MYVYADHTHILKLQFCQNQKLTAVKGSYYEPLSTSLILTKPPISIIGFVFKTYRYSCSYNEYGNNNPCYRNLTLVWQTYIFATYLTKGTCWYPLCKVNFENNLPSSLILSQTGAEKSSLPALIASYKLSSSCPTNGGVPLNLYREMINISGQLKVSIYFLKQWWTTAITSLQNYPLWPALLPSRTGFQNASIIPTSDV